MNGNEVAASGLTALALVTAGITALWRAFKSGEIVSGKTYDATTTALKDEQQFSRGLVSALERKNDLDEKLIAAMERRSKSKEKSSG